MCAIGGVFNILTMLAANLVGFVIGTDGISYMIDQLTNNWGGTRDEYRRSSCTKLHQTQFLTQVSDSYSLRVFVCSLPYRSCSSTGTSCLDPAAIRIYQNLYTLLEKKNYAQGL